MYYNNISLFLLYFWSNKCSLCEHKKLYMNKSYRPQTLLRFIY